MFTTKFTHTCACCGKTETTEKKGEAKPVLPSGWHWEKNLELEETLYYCSRACLVSFDAEKFKAVYSDPGKIYYGLKTWHVHTCDQCKKAIEFQTYPSIIGGGGSLGNWYVVERKPVSCFPSMSDEGAKALLCSSDCLQEALNGILKPYVFGESEVLTET